MWLSLVERCVRDAEAAGSNPVIPTLLFEMQSGCDDALAFFLFILRALRSKPHRAGRISEELKTEAF